MLPDTDGHIEIAGLAAVNSGIALAANAYALPIARARLYADLQRLRALHHAFTMTDRAWRLHFACAAAARAGDVEFHSAAGLRDVPAAVALRAGGGSPDHTAAMAI